MRTKSLFDNMNRRYALKALVGKFRQTEGCWEWESAMHTNGYGKVTIRYGSYLAHRAVYEVFVGRIPDGLTLDHLCRNRTCVNPAHLEPCSSRVNTLRGETPAATNAGKTHCVNGHELAGNNLRISGGRRRCRACIRDRMRMKRGYPVQRPKVTHCKRGHPLEGHNVIVNHQANGQSGRTCRTCHNDRVKEYAARQKAKVMN